MKKRFSFKRLLYGISCLLVLTGLAGIVIVATTSEKVISYPEEPERISFAIYGDPNTQAAAKTIAQTYEGKTGCIVDLFMFSTLGELKKSVISRTASGNNYDVFLTDGELLHTLAEEEEVIALDEIVTKRKKEGQEFYENALKAGTIDHTVLAIPIGVTPYLLYYNKDYTDRYDISIQDIISDGGWDTDIFSAYINGFAEKFETPALAVTENFEDAFTFLSMNHGKWTYYRGNLIENTTLLRTVDTIKEWLNNGSVMFYEDSESAIQRFLNGEVPMLFGDFSMTRKLYSSEFSWDILPVPSPEKDYSSCTYSVSLMAAGNSGNQERAADFIDYYASVTGQKIRLESGECEFPSLRMTFYTSMGDVKFPEHSNYYFYVIEYGKCLNTYDNDADEKNIVIKYWNELG